MQKAAFSIINYQFDKVNIDFDNHSGNDLDLSFDCNGVFINENSSFDLTFKVIVISNKEKNPFVTIQCKGVFKFENVSSFEEIPDFFYRNSIAILFPYVRAYVSLVTTQANIPGIILPTLNLTGLEVELKKNTTIK